MIQIKIDITGPGLTIANETYLIKELLEERGYEVELIDKYPPEKEGTTLRGEDIKIILETHHQPWGG